MQLRNSNTNKNYKNNKQDIRFQINDFQCYNETLDDSDLEEYEDNSTYVMNIFGIDETNESISVKVLGFKPRFYINIPNKWNNNKIRIFIDTIKGLVKKRYKDSLVR